MFCFVNKIPPKNIVKSENSKVLLLSFKGHVLIDIHPNSATDLLEITTKIPFYAALGIKALHLKDKMLKNATGNSFSEVYHPTSDVISIFQAAFDNSKPFSPNDYSLIKRLADDLHSHNMSLMVQIPVFKLGIIHCNSNLFGYF